MSTNKSPWIHQLDHERPVVKMIADVETDVCIIGGGIAGLATAFFTLVRTDKNVVLLEGYKIAHGATGHNAGQVTSYFERPFSDLVREFGLEKAARGQKDVEDAWGLLDEMYTTAGLDIPMSRFMGHAGLSSEEQILAHLENNKLRVEAGLSRESIRVAEDAECLDRIPHHYRDLYHTVPRREILKLLETEDNRYIASLSFQKGCVNSALFVQEIVSYLQEEYGERFSLYEHALVNKLILRHDHILLDVGNHTATAERVVLCTNGFNHFTIVSETGLETNSRFHHHLGGRVGYMSGYLETPNKQPTAISYFIDPHVTNPQDVAGSDPYFYLTRRPYEYEQGKPHNLICIGGPDVPAPDHTGYSSEADYPEEIVDKIDSFVKGTYDTDPNKKIDYIFNWHGLMGYTKNGLRMVGPDPVHPILFYNLGCNGVGILPSLFGGSRIAGIIAGKKYKSSIFDVPR